jgi:hypothetical protein
VATTEVGQQQATTETRLEHEQEKKTKQITEPYLRAQF